MGGNWGGGEGGGSRVGVRKWDGGWGRGGELSVDEGEGKRESKERGIGEFGCKRTLGQGMG